VAPDDSAATSGVIPSASVRLFIERAQTVRDDLDFTAEHAEAVRAICQRLDGLPLAIELAAARVNVLPPAGLLARLERRLPLLTLGPRDAPARLQTMRDAIAWSYDLLTEQEQTLFRRLAVFVGGFTLEAAEWVAGSQGLKVSGDETGDGRRATEEAVTTPSPYHPITPTPSVLDLVSALVDKSLLRADVVSGDTTRYSMLETIREFGLEQLTGHTELEAVQQRHAAWYLAFAADAGPRAKQPGAAPWVEKLVHEHPNLRAALTSFLTRGDGQALVRMAGALWPFWHEQTFFAEGHRWLEVALDLGQTAPAADRIVALTGAGTLAWYQTRIEQAATWHEQALVLAREIGDRAAEAFALINLSAPAMEFGDYDLAFTLLDEGLEAARAVGETEAASLALHNLQCLAWLRGDLPTSQQRAEEALALARAEGWDWVIPSILVNYGLATADTRDFARAETYLRQGLELGHARGNLWDVGTALEGLARVRAGIGRARQATRLFGAAAALRDETGIPQSNTDRAYYEPFLTALREELGEEAFDAAWADGRSTSWRTAMDDLLGSPPESQPSASGEELAATFGLTQRELEVLRLLAAGERTRGIGERLFISPATVATHIANIYSKLGVDSRAKATAFAHRHDLV
jgi:non-specific serine/threonine protein kinase